MSAVETITRPTQPDIEYHPDFAKYQERTRLRLESGNLQTDVPTGFPSQLISPLVWKGKDIEKRSDWAYHLNDGQLDEIDAALNSFKGMHLETSRAKQKLIL